MRKTFVRLTFLGILTLALAIGLSLLRAAPGHAAFVASDLMDDNIFDNYNTMSASQIDSWLNSNFPGSCISTNNGFAAVDPTGYTPSGGFTYGAAVSAGQVIYDAARAYGLNPQVLITTLQKEEGLIRGDGPYGCSATAIASAVGYGCPDGGSSYSYSNLNPPLYYTNGTAVTSISSTCVNSAAKAGFSQQLIRAAWLLAFGRQRSEGNTSWNVQLTNVPQPGDYWDNSDDPQTCYGGPMTQGYRKRCSNDATAIYYDGYTTIDGTSVHMDTGATAALYWYTPHFNGNQNFVSIFEGWFGPTKGSLVQAYGDTTVYLLSGTVAYPIYDVNVLNDLAALGPVRQTSASEINTYSGGPVVSRLFKASDGTLYLINASIKLGFPDCNMVADYGYSCSSAIQLGDDQLAKFVTGPPVTHLLKAVSSPTVYYVTGGTRRPIPAWSDVQAFKIAVMNTLTDAFVNQIPFNGFYAYGPGSLVKTLNSPSVYVVKDPTNLLLLTDFFYSSEVGLGTSVRTITSYYSVINSSMLTKFYCNGTDYVGTDGVTYLIPTAMMTAYGFHQSDFMDVSPSCLGLPISSQYLNQFIRLNNGAIFYVSNGVKQYFTNYAAYTAHGGNSNNTINVSDYFANYLPDGGNINS